ncbi:MAG: ABC transporter ATP-binding protein [Alphaproteobacteria bacterium]|nr:ABC transporter ATP-binding protein [Alphaproteobacteria bacterium]
MIRFENVAKVFQGRNGPVQAIANINLDVAPGEIVTLVGPSGCGKSTLLNIIAGLMPPSSGHAFYHGEPVQGIHSDVGYMTQNDHLLPWRTIARNIAVPLEIRGLTAREIQDRVHELISLVGLEGFADAWPTQVSGGMRKRAALARTLAYDPRTLLMDEPFGALDAQLRTRLQGVLLSLCRKLEKTVLFVTHDLDEAIALADRCVVFSRCPGTILTEIKVGLPRERNLSSIRFDPAFLELTKRLWTIFAENNWSDEQDSTPAAAHASGLQIAGAGT